MRLPAYRPLFIVAGLLTALTYLWHESTSPDLERRHHIQDVLRLIELHDAELMRDILLARAGLLPNYDALSKTGHVLENISQDLLRASQFNVEATDTAMAHSVQQVTQTLQAKLTEVEYFKSDNALLRNSMAYFNKVGQSLSGKAKSSANVDHLWQLMFRFLETPEADLAQAIQLELDALEKFKQLPPEYESLIAHGRLIVELLPRLDVSLRGIIQIPIADKLAALQAELLKYSMSIEKRAQTFRLMLYLVALCLVVYLLYQFVRLRLSNESLRRAHEQLQQESNERLQAEIALRASEERLRSMTDSAHEAIISVDSLAKVVSWNRGAQAMFGYSETAMLGQPLLLLIPEHEDYINDAVLTRKSTSTDAVAVELQGQRQDGKAFPSELSLSSWSRGSEFFMTVIIRDISVRKRLEELARQQELKLIQANKMTALGTLVSGVAHEINNPNQMISLNAGLLAEAWHDAQDVLDAHYQDVGEFFLGGLPYSEMAQTVPVLIHDIKDGASRIERIVADLKNFARPKGADTRLLFSLNDVVERSLRLLGHLIARKTSQFHLELADALPLMSGDPQQIEQVIVNLIVNALEALPDSSHAVSVKTYTDTQAHTVNVEVCDQGVGIAPEHLAQLCDPFFTTKQTSGGTGLGLAITASLIQAHGGRLHFASTLGQGTTVIVVFPESSS